jgi:hypothetical protein
MLVALQGSMLDDLQGSMLMICAGGLDLRGISL